MVPTLSVLLALAVGRPAVAADVVVVPLAALPGPRVTPPERPPVRALVAALDAEVVPGDESRLSLRWQVQVLERGWVDLPLVGEDLALRAAELDGRPLSLTRAGDGWRRLAVELGPGLHTVWVDGTVATPGAALQLPVARGASGRLRARAEGLAFTVTDAVTSVGGRWDLRPGDTLDVRWAPERPPPPRPRVVTFDGAVALRAGEDGVEGAARLRYRVIDGTVTTLTLRIPGGVEQLEVQGRQVARHRVEGERVIVELTEPVSGRVQLDLEWRGAAPPARLGRAPVPTPEDARGAATVTLVRGDDSMLVPAPGRGMVPVPTDQVPRWGRGLVAGQPLVAYRTDAAERAELQWQRLSWQPVDAPPTLIDEARYTVVHADHGRVHVRAAFQVRNDRNPFLRLRLPAGWEAVGLRVAGRTAEPVRAADGRWLVPLEKSVETLDGLVAFPVELMLVGDEPAWQRRGLRALETPAVDAPIAYARWEVRLPRDVHQRDLEGRPTLVDAWSPREGGLFIGRATGTGLDADETIDERVDTGGRRGARALEGRREAATASKKKEKRAGGDADKAVSQEYWNRAYSAYKDNNFDEAEALLQQSLSFDSSNASARSLQDNVFVLRGEAVLDDDQQAAANRVRELARARTGDVELAQARQAEEAERRLRAGDLDGARSAYEDLVEITAQLAAVEQAEAVDQKSRLDAYRQQVAELGGEVGRGRSSTSAFGSSAGMLGGGGKAAPRKVESRKAEAKPDDRGGDAFKRDRAERLDAPAEEFDFEDLTVEGEGVQPSGVLLLDRRAPAAPAPEPVASETPPLAEAPPLAAPAPAPPPPPTLTQETLQRIPTGRSYQSAVGVVVAGATAAPGTLTLVVPGTLEEEAALDAAAGGSGLGVEGQAPAPAFDGFGWHNLDTEEPAMPESGAPDDREGDERSGTGPAFEKVAVEDEVWIPQSASMEVVGVRRRGRVAAAVRNIGLRGGRHKAPAAAPPVPPRFPVDAPSPAPFPAGDPASPASPVAAGPGPRPAHPHRAHAPVAFPITDGRPMPAMPVSVGGGPPSYPRASSAPPAWPRRPPPAPAAPFGLALPDGITASTLSLSLPETGTGLLLEQRLLPPDEPLRLTLKYRNRR